MNKLASNATLWMASPSKTKGKAKPTTVNQEILRYIAIFFGGLCTIIYLLALLTAWQGGTSWQSAHLILAFTMLSLGLHLWVLYSAKPFTPMIVQTIVGAVICPITYLAVDGVLAPWWPGYVLIGFSSAVAWSLYLSRTLWAKLILAFFIFNLAVTTLLGVPDPNLYDLGIRAGLLGLIGLMLIQMTEVLSGSLSKVYERSLQHRHAKEELQELTNLKMNFFSNISHEFRTPITLTLGPLESILNGRLGEVNDAMRSQLGTMVRNQQRLLALINQILDISKAEAGASPLRLSKIKDINRFIEERIASFHPAAESRGIELKTAFDPLAKDTEIYIDKEKIDKVLLNLLSNALKFTPEGFIEVATEMQSDHLLIKVRDSGIGIKASELDKVFDRFRQAEGSTNREFAGTGLGLALVKEFAQLHGGDVSVKSRYGKGTTFKIKLPLGKPKLSEETLHEYVEEDSEAGEGTPQYQGSASAPETPASCIELNAEMENLHDPDKPTVICAEDNDELRYFIRDMLIDHYNVYVAANGNDGLDLAKQKKPHLILSDMKMPGMNGLEFCRKIREDRALRSIPFVLLTGSTVSSNKMQSLEEGADDYLLKPFSEQEVLTRVRNLVSLRKEQLRVDRELEEARAIQRSLLPAAPQNFDGAILDFFFSPSDGLSGDFCDIIPKGDWVYFYVADVTSHGTASAQVTYLLKEIFSHLIEGSPQEISLEELTAEAQKRYSAHHLEYYVALQIARYHKSRHEIEVLRASMPTPLRIGHNGAGSKSLHVRPSPALSWDGPKSLDQFHSQKFTLNQGDVIYFYSDGCFEFDTPDGDLGLKSFHELLKKAPDSEEWKDIIYNNMCQLHGDNHFPDDVTFLKLKLQ